MTEWIKNLFQNQDMLQMDHCQRPEDLNLGMGWLYYGMTRLLRPQTVVVIGSWRGLTPILFGKALMDNNENGQVIFIDPSLVDDFWKNPDKVQQHFAHHGTPNIRHFLMTTQDFTQTADYASLSPIGILMVDGYHTQEQAKFDYEAFLPKLETQGIIFFHDTSEIKAATLYGKGHHYQRTTKLFIDVLRLDNTLEILHLPLATGLTMIKRKTPPLTKSTPV